ncbi:MAG: DUF4287 domain-containing protein [Chthoniobacterales bacterium]
MEDSDPDIKDDAVRNATGRTWREWMAALGGAGLEGSSHEEIVDWLDHQHSVPSWWRQAIAVAFERSLGRRDRRELPDGLEVEFEVEFATERDEVFRCWAEDSERQRWLRRRDLTITDLRPPGRLSARWLPIDSDVEVFFDEGEPGRTAMRVLHRKIPNEDSAEKLERIWSNVIDRLRAHLVD